MIIVVISESGKQAAGTLTAPPQNPHKFGVSDVIPTRYPQTMRHYSAHDSTAARMDLLVLTSQYAGRGGWRGFRSRVAQGAIELLKSGRSAVRPRP